MSHTLVKFDATASLFRTESRQSGNRHNAGVAPVGNCKPKP